MVWRFVDGKPGHENQTAGLLRALETLHPLDVHTIGALPAWKALLGCIGANFSAFKSKPAPDLIVGAGHRTHLSMLAAKRARGGRTVVLMKPSLPPGWFDLCVVPEHDDVPAANNIMVTKGVLNKIQPGMNHDPATGFILLGGPSAHFGWDENDLLEQIQYIIQKEAREWTIATSRRTPSATITRIRSILGDSIRVVTWQETDENWLPEQLAKVGNIWITEDSVSMVYEALTSAAPSGLIQIPRTGDSRVSQGIDRLVDEHLITTFSMWKNGEAKLCEQHGFNESRRCAKKILGLVGDA